MPEFEHEEGVEALGVIDAELFVLGDEVVDCGEVEVGGGEGVGGEEVVVEHGSEGGTEPVADGYGEAHFGAFEDEVWEIGGEGFAEHSFGAAAEELGGGEAGGEGDEIVVHERGADFEGVEHGGAVELGEEIVGEVGEAIDGEGVGDEWAGLQAIVEQLDEVVAGGGGLEQVLA